MTEQERIQRINAMGLEPLLRIWRFEKSGSPWTSGAVGDHLQKRLGQLRDEAGPAAWTAASKAVGWG